MPNVKEIETVARIPRTVAHYAKNHPDTDIGGVSAFARNLRLVFDNVMMITPSSSDWDKIAANRIPVICDNQWVCSVPKEIPTIGFQHGVAAVKYRKTRSLSDFRLALRQQRAARRENTIWVACAGWISDTFEKLYGSGAAKIIYHQVDLNFFDGRLDNHDSRLVLHDARSTHKGKRQIEWLADAFPTWRFEPLACAPSEVPARMRRAAAFVHLSRYEGNSIVCNEAMAQNLPCLFTRVGLMKDDTGPRVSTLVDADRAFSDKQYLIEQAETFFSSMGKSSPDSRAWLLEHASISANISAWLEVMEMFDAMQNHSRC